MTHLCQGCNRVLLYRRRALRIADRLSQTLGDLRRLVSLDPLLDGLRQGPEKVPLLPAKPLGLWDFFAGPARKIIRIRVVFLRRWRPSSMGEGKPQ